ncbi:MAG: DUF3021 family protein [Lachnospiraceae bacterium]|nr:DUF3021 family protein [Lachnospiraceae bacterium]
MKEILKRGAMSFAISSFVGLLINLIIDVSVNACGLQGFASIAPDFMELFPSPVIAAYVNVLLYGVLGAVFAMMTFIFDCNRIGYLVQGLIYFLVTAMVCMVVTVFLWHLHRYPKAMICTLAGYGVCYVIMGFVHYRKLKSDVQSINEELAQAEHQSGI